MKPLPPLDPQRAVLCVPTREELDRLGLSVPAAVDPARWRSVETIGFGPVAAAARTAELCARLRPERIVLAGIAGGYPAGPAPGQAAWFGEAAIDGIGAGEGPSFLSPSALGYAQWEGVDERLSLADEGPLLLTVCSAAAGSPMLAMRRARFSKALAEDMEAFGAALAGRLAGIPVHVLRGISNAAGDRNHAAWRVTDALRAVGEALVARTATGGAAG